jgi:formylglycine-generating enzyme required for sulfatase activity
MYKSTAENADSSTPEGPYFAWVDKPENWSTDPDEWGYMHFHSDDPAMTRWDRVRMIPYASGYRLPTEAQWEYACRADTTTPFNTGNTITTDQANWCGYYPYNSPYDNDGLYRDQILPVGFFDMPNKWGLHDMHGNVREWCWDWYFHVRGSAATAATDPTGPDTGTLRVTRGGSFYDYGRELRSAFRNFANEPTTTYKVLGFRLVRSYGAPAVLGE